MKKLWLLLAVLLTAILLLASCGADIEDGEIDVDDDVIAALPCTVEVEGLEGVSGTISVDLVSESGKADALSKVKEIYYVADGAATYAVEIKLEKDGQPVSLDNPITVKIGLKTHDLPLDRYVVFHLHGDTATEIVPTVTENYLTFSVSDFSIFLVVPKHVHTAGALVVDEAASCTKTGTGHISCSVCGKTLETKTIDKTEHTPGEWVDDAAAGKSYKECTVCHARVEEKPYTPPAPVNNRFAGTSLTYVGYNGAIYDTSVFPTSKEVNEFLAKITISFFNDGTVDADGNVTGARFEIKSTNADGGIDWAIFGTYSAEANALSCSMTVSSYYNGATGKYYHSYHMEKFPRYFLEVNGGIGINTDKGLYEVASYVSNYSVESGKHIAVKGSFFFQRSDAAPSYVTGLPEDTNDDNYERFVEGKVFTFSGASSTGSDAAVYNTAYAGATVSFFAENYAELRLPKMARGADVTDVELVLCGNYTIEEADEGYRIVLVQTKRYYNGEETNTTFNVTLRYDATDNTVKYDETGADGSPVTSSFAYTANATPTKYVAPSAPDNWDADLIAAAFRAVGATQDVSLPKLDGVKSMTKSDLVNGKVTVTILTASNRAAIEAADLYKGRTIPYAFEHTRYEGNFDYYLTAHNQAEFGLRVDNTASGATVTIVITAFAPAYPANEISAYLVDRDVTDGIIDFRNANAVEYVWGDATLSVYLRKDAAASEVLSAYARELTTAGRFKTETVSGKTLYVSENSQIVFYLSCDTSGSRPLVQVGFLDPSVLPMLDYPADLIASLLNGTDDAFFNFAQTNATEYKPIYHEGDFEGTFHIYLPTKAGQDGKAASEAINNGFAALGYVENVLRFAYEDEPNCKRSGLVSPDREIAVRVTGYDVETMIKWGYDGTYTYAVVEVINLTKVDNLAWITAIEVTPNQTQYPYGFYFDARVTATYSDGSTDEPSIFTGEGGNTVITVTPDTETDGVKTVTVTYLGVFSDSYEIYLGEPDVIRSITASGYTTTYYKGDEFVFDGTLTATWSKSGEMPLSVEDVTFYPVPDMTTLGSKHVTVTLKTDATVSCSVDFYVIGRDVSCEYRNVDEWDITEGYAKFAVYAIGGSVNGTGKWVSVRHRSGIFTINVDKDTTSFYIVRLSVDTDVFDGGVYDLDSDGVLNVSGALTLPASSGGTVPTFSFGEQ